MATVHPHPPLHFGNDPLDPHRLSLSNGLHPGEFFIGPRIPHMNATPLRNISEFLAKRDNSDEFVTLKMLLVSDKGDKNEDQQAKVLLLNEHLILSLLQDQEGVVHHQGLFKDRNRFILVLDCLVAHLFDPGGRYRDFINLQHYVIKEKRLREKEALELFHNVLTTIEAMHKKNIVHRDLKLGNMVLNTRTKAVTLINFGLSKHLVRENLLLTDQRGSLAYVSPDVLSGNPYCGKASDMWAAGVLLYTMLYGQFPFYDNDPQELFRKIRGAEYPLPVDSHVSMETSLLIRQLIELDVKKRLTASRALQTLQNILSRLSKVRISEPAQIVPDLEDKKRESDFTVPDHQEDGHLPMATDEANLASNADMNALRLSLSPILLSESHTHHTFTPNGLSSPVNSPYGSPNFMPNIFTEFPIAPSHMPHPRPSSSSNPFLCLSTPAYLNGSLTNSHGFPHSSPTNSHGFPHSSPTNSLGFPHSSPTNSLGFLHSSPTNSHSFPHSSPTNSLPANSLNLGISIHPPTSPSYSYPPPNVICHHRFPLALSLSTDSYFTVSPPGSHQQAFQFPTMATPHEVDRSEGQSVIVSNQNVLESLVTVRRSSNGNGSNRHSFTEGEQPNPNFLSLPLPGAPRRRRNSSGSDQRVRRVSHNSGDSIRRARRRSHDVGDERMDILERLRTEANRWNSRTQSRVLGPITSET